MALHRNYIIDSVGYRDGVILGRSVDKVRDMSLTQQELERRKKHIGSSDMPVILGLSPWRTAYDLWLEKTGKLMPQASSENEAMALGHAMEGHLLRWGAQQIGDIKIIRNQFRVHQAGILSCTHDALERTGKPIGLEAKTAGILRGFADREEWGEDKTDEIPENYIIQCQVQLMVSGLEIVYVPALLGGRGRHLYVVKPNKDIQDIILERAHDFWEKNVLRDIPPEGLPSIDVARYIRRSTGKRVNLEARLVNEWRILDAAAKEAADKADQAKAAVLAALGDAEQGDSDAGIVIAKPTVTKRIDTEAIKSKYPDIVRELTKETTSVRVTFKKAKGEREYE